MGVVLEEPTVNGTPPQAPGLEVYSAAQRSQAVQWAAQQGQDVGDQILEDCALLLSPHQLQLPR